MDKEKFFESLTKDQKEYVNFLIDQAYSNGHFNGAVEQSMSQEMYRCGKDTNMYS